MEAGFADIEENIKRIRENVCEAALKSGRSPDDIRIMAVTKTVPFERVNFAASRGLTLLGENRVQEFLQKKEHYVKNAEVHFIGHLQSNKIKYIIDSVEMIESVDSVKLGEEISRKSGKIGRTMDILCEVNVGGEESKSGFSPEEVTEAVGRLAELPGIRVRGLMTIPPPAAEVGSLYFEKMQRIFEDTAARKIPGTDFDTLSMGMSADYAEAVRFGSTLVRIGSGLFGARNYPV